MTKNFPLVIRRINDYSTTSKLRLYMTKIFPLVTRINDRFTTIK